MKPLKIHALLRALALSSLLALSWWALPVQADTVSGTITTDNAYVLYYGNADGSGLTQITSGSDWHVPQTFTINIPAGSYLYVLAWNVSSPGSSNPQAWLGEFNLPGGTLYSHLNDWQYKYSTSGNPSYFGNSIPDTSTLVTLINTGSWNTATPSIGNDVFTNNMSLNGDSNIWTSVHGGAIAGISTTDAYWIWWDTFSNSASQDGYALFRSENAIAAVPLPGAILLLGAGLFRLAAYRRRRHES